MAVAGCLLLLGVQRFLVAPVVGELPHREVEAGDVFDLSAITPKQAAQCAREAYAENGWGRAQCAAACRDARKALPKPKSHNACLGGCEAGVKAALAEACSGQAGVPHECVTPPPLECYY